MKKRSLVIFMAFLMLFQSMIVFSANAEEEREIIYLTEEQAKAESRADLVKLGLLDCMFADTEGHWAEDIIDELAMAGIINGREEDIFDPDGTVTNAEFVKLLTCSVEEYNQGAYFEEGEIGDVSSSDWHYSYIASALDAGIIYAGDHDSYFLPNENIKRGETAIWISRALGIEAIEDCQFTDIYDEEVKKAVAAGYSQGIITGYDAYTYGPDNTLTRAEAAALVQRVMRTYNELNTPRESKNTATYNENVIEIKNDGENEIASTNSETGEIVFENCTDSLKNATEGQVLYIESCDDFPDGGVVKVDSIDADGNKVTVKTSVPTLEEVFSEIDLSDSVTITQDNYIPGTSDEEIVLMTPVRDSDINNRKLFLSNDSESALRTLSEGTGFQRDIFSSHDTSDLLMIKIKGKEEQKINSEAVKYKENGLTLDLFIKTPKILYDINFAPDENGDKVMDLELVCETTVEASAAVEKIATGYEESWKMGEFIIRIYGPIVLKAELELKFTSEGKFEFEVNAVQTNQAGIRIKDKKATLIKSNNLTKTYSAKAEGMMEVGPVVTVGLGLKTLLGSVNIVDVEGKAGFSIVGEASTSITAETDGHDVSYYKQANEKGEVHTCDACIKGEIFLYLNGDVGINSDLTDALGLGEMRIPFGNGKKHILGNWYYSISAEKGNKFDYGECPNYYKQLEFEEITKSDTDIFVGDEINLKARVPLHMEAAHPVSYKWIQSNKEYSHLVLSNQTSYDLNIPYAHVSDSGTYYCIAYYTELGEELLSAKSEPMHVAVNEGNIYFVENPSGNISIDKGGKFTLYAEAESNRGMKCQYLWYKNGQPISSGRYYSVDRATVYDGGSYYCVVTAVDDYGNSYERKISKTMKVEVWEGVTFPDLQPDEGVLMPFKYCKADGRVRTGYVYRYIKEDGDYITRVYY